MSEFDIEESSYGHYVYLVTAMSNWTGLISMSIHVRGLFTLSCYCYQCFLYSVVAVLVILYTRYLAAPPLLLVDQSYNIANSVPLVYYFCALCIHILHIVLFWISCHQHF